MSTLGHLGISRRVGLLVAASVTLLVAAAVLWIVLGTRSCFNAENVSCARDFAGQRLAVLLLGTPSAFLFLAASAVGFRGSFDAAWSRSRLLLLLAGLGAALLVVMVVAVVVIGRSHT